MIEDISERLLREFAQRLQASLTDEPAKDADEAPEPEAAAEPAAPEPEPKAEEPEPKAEEVPEPILPEPEPEPLTPDAPAEPAAATPPPPPQENEPLDAGSLVGSVMAERVKRNPGPLVLLLGVVVALIALRRKRG
jgi:hypothetical protein